MEPVFSVSSHQRTTSGGGTKATYVEGPGAAGATVTAVPTASEHFNFSTDEYEYLNDANKKSFEKVSRNQYRRQKHKQMRERKQCCFQ